MLLCCHSDGSYAPVSAEQTRRCGDDERAIGGRQRGPVRQDEVRRYKDTYALFLIDLML
jgi:hypothetical protein